ncbi:fimbrial protein [Kluyvera genomosp. 1]|uniref:fimbrial protein n=1 Tax=Kluyvera genomosp. 1 TaxID=2774053 RepID=UPI00068FF7CC|nr:fimbrial protein [Kluyvera genomosp. 1]
MNKLFILIMMLFCAGEAMAECTYSGSIQRQVLTISPRIALDPSIPVGAVLYSKKLGTGTYKTFTCSKTMNDQYIIDSTSAAVAGVTGLQGKPVYETGIDGIGYQVSDLLLSKNGSLVPAVVGSTVVPVESTMGGKNYEFITVWLIKTKPTIDTNGTSINPVISFSAGNLQTNPKPNDRLLYQATIKLSNLNYKNTSCDVSVAGSSQIKLKSISKDNLMSVSRGGITPSQKTITMNLNCPQESLGTTVNYWFNPVSGASASGNGIMDNQLTGTGAAQKVGIIIKRANSPVEFYNADEYQIANVKSSQSFDFTADYYRSSDNAAEVTLGNVKAALQVVIQEQ